MKLAAFNCRGLGNDPAIRGLLDLVKKVDPDILFLCETKLDEKNCNGNDGNLGCLTWLLRTVLGRVVVWRCSGALE